MIEHLPLGVDPETSAAKMENDKKKKVKETKKKKKSKVALFTRAALRWFCFSPSDEPFRFPSSDDYEVFEKRMVEEEELKEMKQEEEEEVEKEKEVKVKERKKKKKKSKVASFTRAALRWFCFSPSDEPFRFPSSDGK
nr:probable nucleolar protein 5-1 isoform X1 [Danio rerio]|eukprot:XP_009300604.2 probable nucleolar protein 5-1 isoform X1 [Danio rerio]